ncbi:MAG TPA: excisionase [Actinomycetota bacterium]
MTQRQPPAHDPSADDEPASPAGPADDAVNASVDWDRLISRLAEQPQEDGWVTLQEASSAAGVARSTLRSWYRAGHVPSRMVAGTHGPQRLVPLDAVLDRALQSSRARRQLEHARSLEAEVEDLRRRVRALERHLGLDGS